MVSKPIFLQWVKCHNGRVWCFAWGSSLTDTLRAVFDGIEDTVYTHANLNAAYHGQNWVETVGSF